jgi:phage repressor protein C with HTH and peptisase S24 domain
MEKNEIGISRKNMPLLEKALEVSASEIYGGNSKMIPLKYYDIYASAGKGCFTNFETFEIVNMDEEQLKRIGINGNYENISIINAKGDSMKPTIHDGDLMFVDATKKEIFNKKFILLMKKVF